MDNCIFCKIIKGEIPSKNVYEDELVYVFEDIEPTAPIHYLAIPKEHISKLDEINSDNSAVIAHIYEVIAKIAKEKELKDGFRVVTNCGEQAGQTVFHIHFHMLAGRSFGWPAG
ncbi:MAG: histidine triad nucleotide-binding protein [Ruminococcus sp.]|nr:histidine triad nucleotide-binding protein [Ruminococcus sp.]